MTDRRDRSADVHMKDGVLRKGRLVGHIDANGRVRDTGSPFRRGEELGSIDDRQRVRRRGGVVGRGEIVGRLKGNALFDNPGLLAGPKKLGYVDATGSVFQTDCAAFRGREIGKARGADPESALAYFLLKFQAVLDHVETLEEKVTASTDRFTFLPRVRALLKVLPEVDALGDFDLVVQRLEGLEALCATELDDHLMRHDEPSRGLRHSVARLGEAASIEALRRELTLPALEGIERAEELVGKVADRLRRDLRNSPPARAVEQRPSEPPATLPPSPLEAILASTLGPMEKLREEVERVRRDPDMGSDELWDRVRTTVSSLLEYRDMTSAVVGRLPAGVPSSGPLLPPPMTSAADRIPRAPRLPEDMSLEDDASPASRAREQIDRVLDTPAASQVFLAIDSAIEGLERLRSAREDGIESLRDAAVEGALGIRALAKAREDGAAGIRAALTRLKELRGGSTPPPSD